jgi:excisionase family DNA binding protein
MHANITNKLLKAILSADDGRKLAAYRALTAKEPQGPKTADAPLLLSMTQAATALGVSRTTLWAMVQKKRIATVEVIPGLRRIRRSDIVRFVKEGLS